MRMNSFLILATVGALSLSACAPQSYSNPNDPNANARAGAIAGAVVGGLAGALQPGRGALGKSLVGAAAGAAVGAIAGGALDQQAQDLRSALGNNNIGVTNTGSELVVSMPQDILFDTNSTVIKRRMQTELASVAQNLLHYPNSDVTIIGHTDNTGSAAYNLQLSQQRADAVAGVLEDNGVNPNRVQTIGRGESQPIATNLTAAGRAKNRRVEIHIRPLNG